MAFFYERGLGGVKPDAAKARYWLEKSAAQGNATAQRSLALLNDRPTVTEVNTRLSPEGTEQLEITRKRLSPEGAEQVEIIRKQPSSPEDAELVESIRRMDQRDPRGFLYHNGYYDGHQVTEEEIEAARRYLQGDGSKK